MLGKGEGHRLAMGMVEVATCHGMAMSMHNGRVPWIRECSDGV